MFRRLVTPLPLDSADTPTRRRADLVVEVDIRADLELGAKLHLAVDKSQLHIFDEDGRRVDPVARLWSPGVLTVALCTEAMMDQAAPSSALAEDGA